MENWVHINELSGQGNKELTVTVDPNNSSEERQTQITARTLNGKTDILTIIQKGLLSMLATIIELPRFADGSSLGRVQKVPPGNDPSGALISFRDGSIRLYDKNLSSATVYPLVLDEEAYNAGYKFGFYGDDNWKIATPVLMTGETEYYEVSATDQADIISRANNCISAEIPFNFCIIKDREILVRIGCNYGSAPLDSMNPLPS